MAGKKGSTGVKAMVPDVAAGNEHNVAVLLQSSKKC
jgi:hypothetical protein